MHPQTKHDDIRMKAENAKKTISVKVVCGQSEMGIGHAIFEVSMVFV